MEICAKNIFHFIGTAATRPLIFLWCSGNWLQHLAINPYLVLSGKLVFNQYLILL